MLERGGGVARVPVDAEVIGAQRVDRDQDDMRRRRGSAAARKDRCTGDQGENRDPQNVGHRRKYYHCGVVRGCGSLRDLMVRVLRAAWPSLLVIVLALAPFLGK